MRMAFTYFRANHEIARRNRSIRISEKPARKLCETSSIMKFYEGTMGLSKLPSYQFVSSDLPPLIETYCKLRQS